MSVLQDKYIEPVDGKAEIKKDNGDTIVVYIKKALDVYNKMEEMRKYVGILPFSNNFDFHLGCTNESFRDELVDRIGISGDTPNISALKRVFRNKDYTDVSLVDDVNYQNGYIIVYTKEHASKEYIRNMLLIPEKLYTGESTVFDVFRESLNHMMEKLKTLKFEEYAAEIID